MAGSRRPPFILLPAAGCDGDLYQAQTDDLADLVEPSVLLVAEPNMGRACTAVLDAAPSRFLLAGASYGGNLALEVAAAMSERVAGLWLMGCNPRLHPDPRSARNLAKRARAGGLEAVVDELAAGIADPAGPRAVAVVEAFRDIAHRVGAEALAHQLNCLADRADRLPDFPQLGCPTLLLWGENDRSVAPDHGRPMQRLMPRAELFILRACGHLPTLEYPAETTALVHRWAEKVVASWS